MHIDLPLCRTEKCDVAFQPQEVPLSMQSTTPSGAEEILTGRFIASTVTA